MVYYSISTAGSARGVRVDLEELSKTPNGKRLQRAIYVDKPKGAAVYRYLANV